MFVHIHLDINLVKVEPGWHKVVTHQDTQVKGGMGKFEVASPGKAAHGWISTWTSRAMALIFLKQPHGGDSSY